MQAIETIVRRYISYIITASRPCNGIRYEHDYMYEPNGSLAILLLLTWYVAHPHVLGSRRIKYHFSSVKLL